MKKTIFLALILGLIAFAVHFLFVPFMPDSVFLVVGLTSLVVFAIYISIINTASQGLHL